MFDLFVSLVLAHKMDVEDKPGGQGTECGSEGEEEEEEITYLGIAERWFESSVHGSIHVRGTTPLF